MKDEWKTLAQDAGFDTEFMSKLMLVQLEIFAALVERAVFESLIEEAK
jgi:hypothetical protein